MTKNWVFYKQKSPRLCMKPTELCEQHQSHFEELKTKQKQEQKEFTQRLLHDLDLEKSQKIDKKAKNVDKKFLSVDSVQDEPAPAHTHDPIRHHSPIPKEKRGVSSVEPPVSPTLQTQLTKRSSLETQQSLHNLFLHNMGLDPINPNIIGHHRSPIPNRKRGVNLVEQPVTPTPQPPPIARRASLDPIGPIDPIGHHSPIPKGKRGVSEQPVMPAPQPPQITRRASLDPIDPVDPIGVDSPIPKEKGGVSSVEQLVPPAPQPRRASLDTQQSQHNLFLHNMGFPHDHSTTCAQYGLIRNICCVD